MNIVAFLKPILSNKIPATLGPMKAPRAKVLVHNPLIRPYVSRLSENPYSLNTFLITLVRSRSWFYILFYFCIIYYQFYEIIVEN